MFSPLSTLVTRVLNIAKYPHQICLIVAYEEGGIYYAYQVGGTLLYAFNRLTMRKD